MAAGAPIPPGMGARASRQQGRHALPAFRRTVEVPEPIGSRIQPAPQIVILEHAVIPSFCRSAICSRGSNRGEDACSSSLCDSGSLRDRTLLRLASTRCAAAGGPSALGSRRFFALVGGRGVVLLQREDELTAFCADPRVSFSARREPIAQDPPSSSRGTASESCSRAER